MCLLMRRATSNFIWAVQSLAAPFEVQVRLYPTFAEVADELVLEHEQAHNVFLMLHEATNLTSVQREKIELLDSYIVELSMKNDASLWTIDAIRDRHEWSMMRKLATEVLTVMGWEAAIPPCSEERGNVYWQ